MTVLRNIYKELYMFCQIKKGNKPSAAYKKITNIAKWIRE